MKKRQYHQRKSDYRNYNGPLSVGYELTVNGHAEMKADSVLLKDLQASQDIYLEANGEIRANELASGADVTIVQRSADPSCRPGQNVDAGDQIFVLNAGGPISLEKSVSGNSTMIFVSQDGYKPDRNVISSRSNRVGIFAAARKCCRCSIALIVKSLISVRILCKLTSAIIIMRYIVMEKTRICLLRVYF